MIIEQHKYGVIAIGDSLCRYVCLEEADRRQLLAWFAREKPQMVREATGMDKVIEELQEAKRRNKSLYWVSVDKSLERAIALLKGEGDENDEPRSGI